MYRRRTNSAWSIILSILFAIIAVAVVFCVVVLVYGACTNMNFVQVLQTWFAPGTLTTEATNAQILLK